MKKDDGIPEVSLETSTGGQQLVTVRLRFSGEIQGFGRTQEEAMRRASFLKEMMQKIAREISDPGQCN